MTLVYAGLVPKKRAKTQLTKEQRDNLADFKKRATNLFEYLKEEEALVVLPSVALSELLVPVPPRMRGVLISKLSERFHIHQFDNHAAAIAADIWAKHNQLPPDQRYDSRTVLKADAMIVATAKAFGASRFYTHDKKCRILADLVMDGHDLPSHRYSLFSNEQLKGARKPT